MHSNWPKLDVVKGLPQIFPRAMFHSTPRCSILRRLILLFARKPYYSLGSWHLPSPCCSPRPIRLDHDIGRLELDFQGANLSDALLNRSEGGSSAPKTGKLQDLWQIFLANVRGLYGSLVVLLRKCPNLEVIRFKMLDAAPSEDSKTERTEDLNNVEILAWEAS